MSILGQKCIWDTATGLESPTPRGQPEQERPVVVAGRTGGHMLIYKTVDDAEMLSREEQGMETRTH